MSDVRPIEDLFGELIELATSSERQTFLDRVCGDDVSLREQLQQLLAAHEEAGSFLKHDDVDETSDFGQVDLAGTSIGPYKLRERIGEGGMGVVYVAEQKQPLRRKVALKVIKPGMDSKAVIVRFEAERNALALMNHPNIAKILDAGTTDQGRPYFVMELVSGNPITKYCDQHTLTIRERLDLFIAVCRAVQHAHQKGIIHRDLKPSNVLVTELDGKPIPKVIDFGVAKALNQTLTEHSIYTSFQSVVGTPLYMSPEQASLSAVDVDTRSDLYSLGAVLYELLTGTTPFELGELKKVAQDEVLRYIREHEPPRPSNRISTLGDTVTRLSQARRTPPDQLSRQVKGDLDWIVMKAIAKERSRRYDSANRLAEDVQRHLDNEIVEARPPSSLYRLRKFAARNRLLVASGSAIVVGLVIAVVGISVGLMNVQAVATQLQERNSQLEQAESQLKEQNTQLAEAKSRLEDEKGRYQIVLRKWQDQLVQTAFADALSGHRAAAEEAIADAELAEAPQTRIDVLRALAALYAGQHQEAVELLKKVVKEEASSVGGWALLAIAYEMTGDLVPKYRALEVLEGLDADAAIEKLFKAWAEVGHALRPRSIEALESIVKDRPNWVVPRLILAQALSRLAIDEGSMHRCTEALTHLDQARPTFGKNPYALSIELEILTVAMKLSQDDANYSEWRKRAKRVSENLESESPDYPFGLMARVWYDTCHGDVEVALSGWQEAIETGAGNRATATYLALLIREGKSELPGPHGAMLAGEVDKALRRCAESSDADAIRRVWIQHTRYLCGEREQAMAVWKSMLESPDAKLPPVARPLELFTKRMSPEQLLEQIEDSGAKDRAHAYFCIANYYLLKRDFRTANRYFDQCRAQNAFMSSVHYLAEAQQQVVRDPTWQASLPSPKQDGGE